MVKKKKQNTLLRWNLEEIEDLNQQIMSKENELVILNF